MVFQKAGDKDLVRVKCTLVPLKKKAGNTQAISELTASHERVLQELVFKGDSAKRFPGTGSSRLKPGLEDRAGRAQNG
jgi:hypothetical protein